MKAKVKVLDRWARFDKHYCGEPYNLAFELNGERTYGHTIAKSDASWKCSTEIFEGAEAFIDYRNTRWGIIIDKIEHVNY